jgi:DNA-binding transcriptional regulator YdaS (Cro superfamily)
MQLARYLRKKALTPMAFSELVGSTDETIRRYMRGARRPSPEMMQRIARATDGKVTPNDFYLPKPEKI